MKTLEMDQTLMLKLTGAWVLSLGSILFAAITRSDFMFWVGLIVSMVTIGAGVTTIAKNIKDGKLLEFLNKRKKPK